MSWEQWTSIPATNVYWVPITYQTLVHTVGVQPGIKQTSKPCPQGADALMRGEYVDYEQWTNLLGKTLWVHLHDTLTKHRKRKQLKASKPWLCALGHSDGILETMTAHQTHQTITRPRTQGLILSTDISHQPQQFILVQNVPVCQELSHILLTIVFTIPLQGGQKWSLPSYRWGNPSFKTKSDLHEAQNPHSRAGLQAKKNSIDNNKYNAYYMLSTVLSSLYELTHFNS